MGLSDEIALFGAVFGAVAVGVSWYAIYRGNRNSSVATLVMLNDGFRQGWQRYLGASDESQRHYEFAELANLLEIACAVLHERSLFGVSRKLMHTYVCSCLGLIKDTPDARARLTALREQSDTFEYLKKFLANNWSAIAATLLPEPRAGEPTADALEPEQSISDTTEPLQPQSRQTEAPVAPCARTN